MYNIAVVIANDTRIIHVDFDLDSVEADPLVAEFFSFSFEDFLK
jgi:hypothetical protein